MPTATFPIRTTSDKGWVRVTDASYPPDGSVSTSTATLLVERSFDGGAGQYRNTVLVVRFYVSLPAGAEIIARRLKATLLSKHDTDGLAFHGENYTPPTSFPPVSGADYDEDPGSDALDVAISTLSVGVNTVGLNGSIGILNGYHVFRFSIEDHSPAGLNDLEFTSLELEIDYRAPIQPANLAIDGNGANGISIDRSADHVFSFTAGQTISGFDLYIADAAGSFTTPTLSSSGPATSITVPGGTLSAGNKKWKVIAQDSEGFDTPASNEKTFRAVDPLTDPTITAPVGLISDALPLITSTGVTHAKEQFEVLESGAVIYNTGLLVQTSGSHQMVSGYFLTDQTMLEDGHSYQVRVTYIASDGSLGQSTEDFNVVFTPPATPTLDATPVVESGLIRLTPDNQGDASIVSNTFQVSGDYDATTGSGTWADIGTADPDTALDWYEYAHNVDLWFRVVAHDATAYAMSDVVQATGTLENWLTIHQRDDAAATILMLEGSVTLGGSESDYARSVTPAVVIEDYMGSQFPSASSEVTTAGKLKRNETWRVTVMIPVFGAEDRRMIEALETLLTTPGAKVLRTLESWRGKVAVGSVTNFAPPVAQGTRMNRYQAAFDFVVTGG